MGMQAIIRLILVIHLDSIRGRTDHQLLLIHRSFASSRVVSLITAIMVDLTGQEDNGSHGRISEIHGLPIPTLRRASRFPSTRKTVVTLTMIAATLV